MREARLLGCYVAAWVLAWGLARWIVKAWRPKEDRPSVMVDLWTIVTVGGLGYGTFWVYLLHRWTGLVCSYALLAAAGLIAVSRLRHGWKLFGGFWSSPAGAAFLVGLMYLSLITLRGGMEVWPTEFVVDGYLDPPSVAPWLVSRAGDDLIPVKLASAVASGGPLRGMTIGFPGWQYSDRPPLQAGVLLLCWPLQSLCGTNALGLAVGTFLQVLWVVGLAACARALGCGTARTRYALLLTILTGCVYYNSVYVWPKFLAAALALVAAVPLIAAVRARRSVTPSEIILASTAAAFAALSHGTVVFSLVAFAGLALAYRPFRSWRVWLPAGLLAVAWYVPWVCYQRFVDPPGDRVLKWMFAAHDACDDIPLTQCLRDAYGRLTFTQWARDRASAARTVLGNPTYDHDMAECFKGIRQRFRGGPPFEPHYKTDWLCGAILSDCGIYTLAAMLRADQVDHMFRCLGVLNVAWLIGIWIIVRRAHRLRRRWVWLLTAFIVLNLILWLLLILHPALLTIRNGSYALLLAVLLLVGCLIYETPPRIRWTILVLHGMANVVLWGVVATTRQSVKLLSLSAWPQPLPAAVLILALIGIAICLMRRRLVYSAAAFGGDAAAASVPARPRMGRVAVVLGVFLAVSMGAVWAKSPLRKLGRFEYMTPHGIVVRATGAPIELMGLLFDGVTHWRLNYGTWRVERPGEFRFHAPQLLREVRLHLYEVDRRTYRFTVEKLNAGRWQMVLDRSQQETGGLVTIPGGEEPWEGIRIIGLSNSVLPPSIYPDPGIHLMELELIPRDAAAR